MKHLFLTFALLAPCAATQAHADSITYITNGTLADGGTFSGTLLSSPTRLFTGGTITILDAGQTYVVGSPTSFFQFVNSGSAVQAFYTNPARNNFSLWFTYASLLADSPAICTIQDCFIGAHSFFSLDYQSASEDAVTGLTLTTLPLAPTPEPSGLLLLGTGVLGLAAAARRRLFQR